MNLLDVPLVQLILQKPHFICQIIVLAPESLNTTNSGKRSSTVNLSIHNPPSNATCTPQ